MSVIYLQKPGRLMEVPRTRSNPALARAGWLEAKQQLIELGVNMCVILISLEIGIDMIGRAAPGDPSCSTSFVK